MSPDRDLVERLEGAEGGSRELDDSVIIAAFGGEMMDWWDSAAKQHVIRAGDGSSVNVTPVTTSLDAALSLAGRVLPGWWWSLVQIGTWFEANLTLPKGSFLIDSGAEVYATASTPALAICAAILRARSLNEEPQ